MIIIMAVSFYTVRIVLDVLDVTDYGLYNLVASFVAMMTFLNPALTSGTQRFLTFEIEKNNFEKIKQTFSTAILLHIGLALLILLFGETIGLWFLYEKMNISTDRFDAAFWVYQFGILSMLVSLIHVPYQSLIVAHEQMHFFAYISLIEAALKLLIVYLLIGSSYDKLITYGILMFIVSLVIAVCYRWYVKQHFEESHFQYTFDKKILNPMLHFSGWNIFRDMGVVVANQGINIILNIFFGPVSVAARAISVQISSALSQFSNGFQQAVTPQIIKLYAANKIEELNTLLFQNAKYAFFLLWLLALPVLLQLEYILHIWLTKVPEDTLVFSQIIILHALFYSVVRPFVMALYAVGNVKNFNILAAGVLLLVVPISYILLKYNFPIYSPLIVNFAATFVEFVFVLYLLKKYVDISAIVFIRETFVPCSLVVIITFLSVYIIKHYFTVVNFSSFIITTIFSIIATLLSVYYLALEENMRTKLKEKLRWN